ncbi:MAG TPA: hypothetical protein VGX25_27960 [Actinophytocola sp.]|uniref:hypothetical protein n=1 Tax=Actinophytocola sp. TaxID=1872138 RepID=UPI002DDD8384|nr:hypothetical protein [Actinophytocola sp.]HEV2783237.1 hypothetical protein [Actinophytocola sp.]
MRHEIQLNLTVDETNTVLDALGQLPYVRVHLLIDKVQQQATAQLHSTNDVAHREITEDSR